MRSPPPAKSLLSVERQLERPRMSCVVAAAVVVVVAVDVDVVAGVGDGCHSGSVELKWQKDPRAGSSLGCKGYPPHPPCHQRGRPDNFCKGKTLRTSPNMEIILMIRSMNGG